MWLSYFAELDIQIYSFFFCQKDCAKCLCFKETPTSKVFLHLVCQSYHQKTRLNSRMRHWYVRLIFFFFTFTFQTSLPTHRHYKHLSPGIHKHIYCKLTKTTTDRDFLSCIHWIQITVPSHFADIGNFITLPDFKGMFDLHACSNQKTPLFKISIISPLCECIWYIKCILNRFKV